MTVKNQIAIALTIATASVLGINSSVLAKPTIDTGIGSVNLGANNGAASVLLDMDNKGNVLGVSAAVGFGKAGAAAIALPEFAGALGTSSETGDISIDNYYSQKNPSGHVNFSGRVGFFSKPESNKKPIKIWTDKVNIDSSENVRINNNKKPI